MAKAAYTAAMDALEINSPSKAFADLGRFVDVGFAQGITKYANVAKDATTGLGESIIDSMLDPVSRIASIVNGNIDSTPSIRPVLNLSSVNSAARQIERSMPLLFNIWYPSNACFLIISNSLQMRALTQSMQQFFIEILIGRSAGQL